MNRSILLVAAMLLLAPAALAHNPPGPVTTCQSPAGEAYHDYLPSNNGILVIGGDGNLADCGPNNWTVGPWLNDNASLCQTIKADPALAAVHTALCTETDTGVSQDAFDYDNEYDYGHGGVFLAVTSGDGSTWGSEVCYGMAGHHSQNLYAIEWPDGSGPAFTVTADHSRTPPAPGPKGPRADCGDSVVEPCDPTPPAPSTQPFPVNVVIDTVNAQLYALFGPSGSGTTCNVNDCAERSPLDPVTNTRSNPTGATHLVTVCSPGIDGALVVFIEPDFDAPDAPQLGHIWTY